MYEETEEGLEEEDKEAEEEEEEHEEEFDREGLIAKYHVCWACKTLFGLSMCFSSFLIYTALIETYLYFFDIDTCD